MIEKRENIIEEKIKKILCEDINVPYHVKHIIRKTLNEQNNRKKKNFSVLKLLVSTCACCILITSVVFAVDISKFIKNFFVNNEGMDNAIENGYIDSQNFIDYIILF